MSAKPSTVSPSPCTTVAGRRGTQRAASRAQLVLTTLGTTTSSGKASAASAARRASAVLPRPGSSASRNVRWPAAAAETTCPWCGISSWPAGVKRAVGAGRAMHAGAPPPARSNELSSGPSSSQPARRLGRAWTGRGAEKSGARKGFASRRDVTDGGTTRRSGAAASAGSTGASSSGGASTPAARSSSRLSDRAASDGRASSASRASSPASRTAILARIAAMPSRRLSCSVRFASVPAAPARTRARSSRNSSATAWNFVRTEGVTRAPWTAASSSRTVRASTVRTSPSGRTRPCLRGALRRAPVWCWPGRATNSSLLLPGTERRAMLRADPGGSTARASAGISEGPRADGRGLVATAWTRYPSRDQLGSRGRCHKCQRAGGSRIPESSGGNEPGTGLNP